MPAELLQYLTILSNSVSCSSGKESRGEEGVEVGAGFVFFDWKFL